MALNIETLRDMVDSTIYSNGEKEITGAALNNTLHSLIDAIAEAATTGSGGSSSGESGGGMQRYIFPADISYTIFDIAASGNSEEFVWEDAISFAEFFATISNFKNYDFSIDIGAMYGESVGDPNAIYMTSSLFNTCSSDYAEGVIECGFVFYALTSIVKVTIVANMNTGEFITGTVVGINS